MSSSVPSKVIPAPVAGPRVIFHWSGVALTHCGLPCGTAIKNDHEVLQTRKPGRTDVTDINRSFQTVYGNRQEILEHVRQVVNDMFDKVEQGHAVKELPVYHLPPGTNLTRMHISDILEVGGGDSESICITKGPLIEWGYDLNKCIEIIESAGLPVPPKSACYLCPNQKEDEVHHLSNDERARIILVELSAEPYNTKVNGLWRRKRKEDGRPGSITEYILQQGLPFTKLTDLGEQIVLNPACAKFKNGGLYTFEGPHNELTLRKQLREAGHAVPEVVLEAIPGKTIYKEDRRQALPMVEDAVHADIIDSL